VPLLRKVLFPRSGRSLSRARKWLLAGTRICTVATGVCLATGLYHHWYVWILVAGTIILLAFDLPFAYQEEHRRATRANDYQDSA
jgi:hypothetical protein